MSVCCSSTPKDESEAAHSVEGAFTPPRCLAEKLSLQPGT